MSKLVVIALGGNALQKDDEPATYQNQMKNIEIATNNIAKLIAKGYRVVITHGNGPQVGRMLIQNELADSDQTPSFPFDAVDAMSQAQIGYQIEQSLQKQLVKIGYQKEVCTLLTQVVVDENDPAFLNPSKPIGQFYTEEEAKQVEIEKGYTIKSDANRGYRRVVASPKPVSIVEEKVIKTLVDNNVIVIACGGGGIPVFDRTTHLEGTAAIIDKDNATNLLAQRINADFLVILTAVSEAMINFGQENQTAINHVDVKTLQSYIDEEQFAKGSMLPKVEAVCDFVTKTQNKAIITSLDNLVTAVYSEDVGTIVSK